MQIIIYYRLHPRRICSYFIHCRNCIPQTNAKRMITEKRKCAIVDADTSRSTFILLVPKKTI